jgi:hypothetical protein
VHDGARGERLCLLCTGAQRVTVSWSPAEPSAAQVYLCAGMGRSVAKPWLRVPNPVVGMALLRLASRRGMLLLPRGPCVGPPQWALWFCCPVYCMYGAGVFHRRCPRPSRGRRRRRAMGLRQVSCQGVRWGVGGRGGGSGRGGSGCRAPPPSGPRHVGCARLQFDVFRLCVRAHQEGSNARSCGLRGRGPSCSCLVFVLGVRLVP